MQTLETGDILPIRNKSGVVIARLIYVGDGKVNSERLMQSGEWKLDKPNQTLNDAQIAAWLARKVTS